MTLNNDSGDIEVVPTTAQLEAVWIEQTVSVRTLLNHGHATEVRNLLAEVDENLEAWNDGGVAPGSEEVIGSLYDAVTRAAIPYGAAPIFVDEITRQLRDNVGIDVPALDLDTIAQRTGITALTHDELARHLDPQAEPTAPEHVRSVATARLEVRRAIASISEDAESARNHLSDANERLTTALQQMGAPTSADVAQAQESVQKATENVSTITETAQRAEAEVTIYTTPDCVACAATKRALDKAGVAYDSIDLSEHPELVEMFKAQGLQRAPIVEAEGDRWAGHNPVKLREHGLDYRSRQQRSTNTGRDGGLNR